MNAVVSSPLTAPLVPLGCLTIPLQVPSRGNRITAYDYRNPVLNVARRIPAGLCLKPGG
jgi:hypothetical protein